MSANGDVGGVENLNTSGARFAAESMEFLVDRGTILHGMRLKDKKSHYFPKDLICSIAFAALRRRL